MTITSPPVIGAPAAPDRDPEALIPEARARQRKRRIRLGLLGAAMAVVVGGGAWIVNDSGSGVLTVNQIAAREAVALERANQLIVRLKADTRYGYSVTWADFAKLQTRTINDLVPSQPRTERVEKYFVTGRVVVGSVTTGQVTYGHPRTWTTYDVPQLPKGLGDTLQGAATIPAALLGASAITGAGAVAVLGPLRYGSRWVYRLVGTDEVNGQSAVELQARMPTSQLTALSSQLRPFWAEARFDVWISAKSYLPIREQIYNGARLGATVNLTWLPGTKANLSLLNIKAPPGTPHSVVRCNYNESDTTSLTPRCDHG